MSFVSKLRLLALACAASLAACAGAPVTTGTTTPAPTATATPPTDPLAALSQFTIADLQAADADAMANNDVIAHACYPALISFIQTLPGSANSTTVAGAVSLFQRGRDLANHVQTGLPVSVKLGCAALVMDTQTLIVKLAAIGVGSAATAGAILPVPLVPAP